jgi:hypothetical protein
VRPYESSTWDIVVDEKTIKSKFVVMLDDLHELQTNSHGAELELRQPRPYYVSYLPIDWALIR